MGLGRRECSQAGEVVRMGRTHSENLYSYKTTGLLFNILETFKELFVIMTLRKKGQTIFSNFNLPITD